MSRGGVLEPWEKRVVAIVGFDGVDDAGEEVAAVGARHERSSTAALRIFGREKADFELWRRRSAKEMGL